jgi:serine/threonine protein kinase
MYAGTHVKNKRCVAVKVMYVKPPVGGIAVLPNDTTWGDALAEVAALCRLQHQNVITLNEFFIERDRIFLVTNLLEGAALVNLVYSYVRCYI